MTRPMQTGLATIRRDGFVSLRVADGRRDGSLVTVPLSGAGRELELEVNASGLSGGEGRIWVDWLQENQVMATSASLSHDGIEIPVHWGDGRRCISLPRDSVRLRFRLEGAAALYSFTFR